MYELKAQEYGMSQSQEYEIPQMPAQGFDMEIPQGYEWMNPVFDTGVGQVCSTLIEVIFFFNI